MTTDTKQVEVKLPDLPRVIGTIIPTAYTGNVNLNNVITLPAIIPPTRPRITKGRLGSISDNTTEKIITGWDWFSKDKSSSDYPLEDQIQVIRAGAIGDNSCFYHSTCKAISPIYQNEVDIIRCATAIAGKPEDVKDLYHARQILVDNFRNDIGFWLTSPAIDQKTGQPYTEADARRYLNTRTKSIALYLMKEVKDPRRFKFKPFDIEYERKLSRGKGETVTRKYKWAHHIYEDLVSDDEKIRNDTYQLLINDTVGHDDPGVFETAAVQAVDQCLDTQSSQLKYSPDGIAATREAALKALRFTPESLKKTLEKRDITHEKNVAIQDEMKKILVKALDPDDDWTLYYFNYIRIINDRLAEGCITNQVLVHCSLLDQRTMKPTVARFSHFVDYMRTYIDKRRKMIDFIKTTFLNPATMEPANYPMAVQREIIAGGVDKFLQILAESINGATGMYYKPAEIQNMLDRDIRVGIIDDPETLKYSININYFMVNEGMNIHHFNDEDDVGVRTFKLKNLLDVIRPQMNSKGKVIGRRDAGEDDIIGMMPFILGIDIYLVQLYGDHIRVHRSYYNSSEDSDVHNSPSIVIHSTGSHFEVVGVYESESVKTIFEPNHPFIAAIHEYTKRLNRSHDGHDGVYRSLQVSKIPVEVVRPISLPISSGSSRLMRREPTSEEIRGIVLSMGTDEAQARTIWHAANSPPKAIMQPGQSRGSVHRPSGITVLKADGKLYSEDDEEIVYKAASKDMYEAKHS